MMPRLNSDVNNSHNQTSPCTVGVSLWRRYHRHRVRLDGVDAGDVKVESGGAWRSCVLFRCVSSFVRMHSWRQGCSKGKWLWSTCFYFMTCSVMCGCHQQQQVQYYSTILQTEVTKNARPCAGSSYRGGEGKQAHSTPQPSTHCEHVPCTSNSTPTTNTSSLEARNTNSNVSTPPPTAAPGLGDCRTRKPLSAVKGRLPLHDASSATPLGSLRAPFRRMVRG